MIASVTKRSLLDRMVGAALLEPDTYEQASLAPQLRVHAALAVALSSLAAGVGSLGAGLPGFLLGSFAALVGWVLYAAVAYWTATARFGVPRTYGTWSSTLRVLGLAASPRVFLAFTLVPEVGLLVGLAVHAWALATTVLAVKIALDMDTRPAVLSAAAGLLPMLLLWALVAALV